MKDITVFEGNDLHKSIPDLKSGNSVYGVAIPGNDGNDERVTLPFDDVLLSKHLLFLGGIGTGKTNGIFQVVSQIQKSMTPNDTMVIFDTKGDFYNTFYKSGDVVISNDDKATGSDGVDYWNIFNELEDSESIEEQIMEIARALFYEKTSRTTQPFFPNAARDIFSAILIHFCRAADSKFKNNEELKAFLNEATASDIKNLLLQYGDLRAMTSYIESEDSPQTQGIFSELQQLIREILIGNFRKSGNLSMRELIRNKGGKTIFVEYDLSIGSLLTPVYRVLLDMALKEALGRKKSDGNVWFIIDEFRLIPNLQHVDNGVNFGRSLGTKFIIGVQNIEQVFHAYGQSMAKSILSGFMTTVAFNINDTTTRMFIQQLFGKNRKKEVYMASVQTRGIIEQVREANVVEDWDLSRLQPGQAIIGMPGKEPFHFKFDLFTP